MEKNRQNQTHRLFEKFEKIHKALGRLSSGKMRRDTVLMPPINEGDRPWPRAHGAVTRGYCKSVSAHEFEN